MPENMILITREKHESSHDIKFSADMCWIWNTTTFMQTFEMISSLLTVYHATFGHIHYSNILIICLVHNLHQKQNTCQKLANASVFFKQKQNGVPFWAPFCKIGHKVFTIQLYTFRLIAVNHGTFGCLLIKITHRTSRNQFRIHCPRHVLGLALNDQIEEFSESFIILMNNQCLRFSCSSPLTHYI